MIPTQLRTVDWRPVDTNWQASWLAPRTHIEYQLNLGTPACLKGSLWLTLRNSPEVGSNRLSGRSYVYLCPGQEREGERDRARYIWSTCYKGRASFTGIPLAMCVQSWIESVTKTMACLVVCPAHDLNWCRKASIVAEVVPEYRLPTRVSLTRSRLCNGIACGRRVTVYFCHRMDKDDVTSVWTGGQLITARVNFRRFLSQDHPSSPVVFLPYFIHLAIAFECPVAILSNIFPSLRLDLLKKNSLAGQFVRCWAKGWHNRPLFFSDPEQIIKS